MPIERTKDEPLDAFLCRILLAAVKQAGGELRIKESEIDIDTRQLLMRDFDPATNEIVFRVGTKYAEPIWVNPRQSAWTIPFEERARQLGLDSAVRSHIPTDEELAAKEQQQRLRRQTRPVAPPTTA
jgi:hypothetical protein